MNNQDFEYNVAFSRNIGLLTEEEQVKVRAAKIAIPGMGGGGGSNFIALVRQGFERFNISDMDVYELKNFNRQYGARLDTIGRSKVEVMKEEALKINPYCQIEIFPEGISPTNINAFLAGVSISVDALDAFAVEERRMFYNESLARNIPVVTAGPIGFGSAFLIFKPGGPNFDEYFCVSDNLTYDEKILRFMIGLVPSLLQRTYMRRTNLKEKRGPSSIASINIGAGIVVIYVLKILLNKGTVKAVPYYHQFDVMRERYVSKRLWFNNNNPLQRIKLLVARFLVTD